MIEKFNKILAEKSISLKNLPDTWKCRLCYKIPENAHQTQCGCRFCEICIKSYLSDGPQTCPCKGMDYDKDLLNINESKNIFPDKSFNKGMNNLHLLSYLQCCYGINDSINHHKHFVSCIFQGKQCENCNFEICFENNKLQYLILKIKYCESCWKCDKIDHNKNNNQIESINENIDNENTSHFEHLIDKKFVSNNINSISNVLETFKSIDDGMKDLNERLECRRNILMENQIYQTFLSQSLLQYNEELKSILLNRRKETYSFRNGEYIMVIHSFSKIRNNNNNNNNSSQNLSIYSDPFYSSENGYKICLLIYPNGIDDCTHLSVYCVIMNGEYDNLLQWPFELQIEISLLNINSNKNHYTKIIEPKKISANSQGNYRHQRIFGISKFISFEKLFNESMYYKNDKIFLKISVSTN